MNKPLVAGAIAVVAVFAGVIYFARDSADESPASAASSKEQGIRSEPVKPADAPLPPAKTTAAARPVVSDPRLQALMVTPDNGVIEFFADAEGRVIKEVDNDPNSVSYRKPLREYTYAGDKVIRLVAYRYNGDQVQIVKADVVYKPDGSIDKYNESTEYEQGKSAGSGG